jgi:hypothetical protein
MPLAMRINVLLFALVIRLASAQTEPRITKASLADGYLSLGWSGDAPSYEVQSSPDLAAPTWSPALLTSHPSGMIPTTANAGFFRIVTRTNTPASSTIDVPARLQILDTINQEIASLPGDDGAADSQALFHFLSQRREFQTVGVSSDSSVWAQFTDGRLFVVVNNRPPAPNPQTREDLRPEEQRADFLGSSLLEKTKSSVREPCIGSRSGASANGYSRVQARPPLQGDSAWNQSADAR